MTRNTVLSGFTLTNGNAAGGAGGDDENGGGIFAQGESSIVIKLHNHKLPGIYWRGSTWMHTEQLHPFWQFGRQRRRRAIDSKLNNCTLLGNSATNYGGGAYLAR
jgi:hypothetical protein